MPLRRTLALVAVVGVATATVTVAAARRDRAPDTMVTAEVARDADHALRAQVRLSASSPTEVTVVVASEEHGFTVTPREPVEGSTAIPLLGLRPDSTYDVTVEAVADASRPTVVDAGSVGTRALPDGVPPVQVQTASDEPGVTLFDTLYKAPEGADGLQDEGALVAVDGDGEVVWYQRMRLGAQDITRSRDGTLLVTYHEMGVREYDPASGLVGEWIGTSGADATDKHGRSVASSGAIEVDTDQMHHEVVELDTGNLLTLSREIQEVTYPEPVCPADDDATDSAEATGSADGTEQVAADTLVEFERETGEIVREFSMWDVLDPLAEVDRIQPSEFCSPYLEPRYPQGDVRDWTHANGIEIDEGANVVWVSNRHTDKLVAFRWQDDDEGAAGELVYQLGEGGDFELVGDGAWFLHQHAPELQDDGTLQIYDNGNWREGTDVEDPEALPYSRVVRYELDTDAMTATQVWEHRFPTEDGVYAPYVGDADTLDNGNVLIAHGGLLAPISDSPSLPGVLRWARIVEVDPSTDEIVWDVTTRDPDDESGWGLYRAERLPHLYPDGYVVEPR